MERTSVTCSSRDGQPSLAPRDEPGRSCDEVGPVRASHTRSLITQCPVRRRPASSCRVFLLHGGRWLAGGRRLVWSRCCAATVAATAVVVVPLVPPPPPGNGTVAYSVLSSSGTDGDLLKVCCALCLQALAFLGSLVWPGLRGSSGAPTWAGGCAGCPVMLHVGHVGTGGGRESSGHSGQAGESGQAGVAGDISISVSDTKRMYCRHRAGHEGGLSWLTPPLCSSGPFCTALY